MFVTEVLLGQPYQSFVPKPVLPCIPRRFTDLFLGLDKRLRSEVVETGTRSAILDAVLRPEQAKDDGLARKQGVEDAMDFALARKELNLKALVEINSRLLLGKRHGLRPGPVWVGAPHPSVATHVGSPAGRLKSLVSEILAARAGPGPVSLAALVSLVRLLQVHPFPDGNGRTARLYSIWLVHRQLGPGRRFPHLVAALWHRSRFCIHHACVAIRDHDDWSPLLEYCLEASETRLDH